MTKKFQLFNELFEKSCCICRSFVLNYFSTRGKGVLCLFIRSLICDDAVGGCTLMQGITAEYVPVLKPGELISFFSGREPNLCREIRMLCAFLCRPENIGFSDFKKENGGNTRQGCKKACPKYQGGKKMATAKGKKSESGSRATIMTLSTRLRKRLLRPQSAQVLRFPVPFRFPQTRK